MAAAVQKGPVQFFYNRCPATCVCPSCRSENDAINFSLNLLCDLLSEHSGPVNRHGITDRDIKVRIQFSYSSIFRKIFQNINRKNTMELRREINRVQRELNAMHRRNRELSTLFKRLYEDNVLGRVTNEQKELAATIPEKKERLERLKSSMANVDAFIEKARRYTAIDELTPELLRLFIQRIEIGEQTKKYSRSAGQSVRIVYRDIGALDTPMWEGDRAPYMAKEIADKEEIMQLLA